MHGDWLKKTATGLHHMVFMLVYCLNRIVLDVFGQRMKVTCNLIINKINYTIGDVHNYSNVNWSKDGRNSLAIRQKKKVQIKAILTKLRKGENWQLVTEQWISSRICTLDSCYKYNGLRQIFSCNKETKKEKKRAVTWWFAFFLISTASGYAEFLLKMISTLKK